MTDKNKPAESHHEPETMDKATEEQDLQSRREFLIGLGIAQLMSRVKVSKTTSPFSA